MIDGEVINCRDNPDLVGHGDSERLLREMIASDRIAGSWLITGPKGIGKATLAYRLARYLLASDLAGGDDLFAGDIDDDGSLYMSKAHPIFHRMIHGSLGDLMVVEVNAEEGKSEIPVDVVRKVGKFLSQTPSESHWRIVIIDSADELNRNAANALLKLLEEPPKNTVMLLVSHAPSKLLPTIRSRCRFIKLRPLDSDKVSEVLNFLNDDLSPELAEFASYLSDGSPGIAAELYAKNGLGLYQNFTHILSSAPNIDAVEVQKLGEKLALKNGQVDWRITTYLLEWFLAKTIHANFSNEQLPEFFDGENSLRDRLLAYYSVDQLVALWENIGKITAQANGLNMDRKLATQQIFGAFAS